MHRRKPKPLQRKMLDFVVVVVIHLLLLKTKQTSAWISATILIILLATNYRMLMFEAISLK